MSKFKIISLAGKLRTAIDGILADNGDFTVLQNYRYITDGVKGIYPLAGMTKIDQNGADYLSPSRNYLRSGIHFKKDSPAENHVLVQGFNTGLTASHIMDNKTAIPSAGEFESSYVYQEPGASMGRFNLLPDNSVGFFNENMSLIWGGDEARIGMFVNYDGVDNAWSYDYTDRINNDLDDAANLASIRSSSDGIAYVLIGVQRPAQGFKFYIKTANNTASSVTGYQHTAAGWTTVGVLTDGTKDTGVSLAIDGSTTFASTVGTAQPHISNGIMQYFFLLKFSGLNNVTRPQIKRVTADMPMQGFTDLWDGVPRKITQFWDYRPTSKFRDFTSNVYSQDVQQLPISGVVSYMAPTFYNASSLSAASYLVICSPERLAGIGWEMVKDRLNEALAAVMNVYYHNGESWVAVSQLVDTTADDSGSRSLNHSGISTWVPPDPENEFKTATLVEGANVVKLSSEMYVYKVQFSAALDTSCYIDYITTIPAARTMSDYTYGFTWQNRVVLINETNGVKNAILVGAQGSVSTFNGADSWDERIGTGSKLMAGGPIYTRYSDGKYEDAIILSMDKTHLLSGTSPEGDDKFRLRTISEIYGCTDPNTFDTCALVLDNGESRNVAMWKSGDTVLAFNGISVDSVSDDVSDAFDTAYHTGIEYGRFDQVYQDYHLYYYGSDGIKEKLFSVKKMGWSDAKRTDKLYGLIPVKDVYGNNYSYGFTSTGHLMRLEYGNTFDGEDIEYKFRTAEAPLMTDERALFYKTKIDRIKLIMVANASGDTVTTKVYDDALTAGYTVPETASQADATHRITQPVVTPNDANWGIFHAVECSSLMDGAATGFQILAIGVAFTENESPDMGG